MWSNIGQMCRRPVVTIDESEDLVAAAQLMREHHVGYLVAARPEAESRRMRPVGVITDRDIVVAVIAKDVDPRTLTVADVMTSDPVLVREDASLSTLLAEMRRIGARRMPIVDADGLLVGVVSLDDVLERLAEELGNIAGSIQHGQRLESVLRT
ncbi:MAG TPA: CBS domain-containing protein [Woeseiaceae bacterium]|jgi:CBS domain-containing protein|nr:CBS domain-containing protein [Woeseiaceae bacterium]